MATSENQEPLIQLPSELTSGKEVYALQAQFGPSGSIKDYMVPFVLEEAKRLGAFEDNKTVVEASSGNTGAALAHYGRLMGLSVHIFVASSVSPEKRMRIESLGASLHVIDIGNQPQGEIGAAARYAEKSGGYLFNQFENPLHLEGYRRNLVPLLGQALESRSFQPDCFFGGVGSGASCRVVGTALKERFGDEFKVFGVVPERYPSDIEGLNPGHVCPEGHFKIWNERPKQFEEATLQVSESEAYREALALEDRGVLVGPASGAALAAAKRVLPHDQTGLVLFCDSSQKYREKYTLWRERLNAELS